jgi:hypothetical protein
MKIPLSIIVLLLSLIMFAPTVAGQTCACKAPGNKGCTATATCPHGCTALCGPKDSCFATCGTIGGDNLQARITIKVENGDGNKVASLLTEKSGRKIIFIPNPRRKKTLTSFELNNAPVWNALDLLSKYGNVLVSGVSFDSLKELRHGMKSGQKVSMHFTDTSVTNAVAELAFVSGKPFRVLEGNGEKLLSISLEKATLRQIIDKISAQAGVRIGQAEKKE